MYYCVCIILQNNRLVVYFYKLDSAFPDPSACLLVQFLATRWEYEPILWLCLVQRLDRELQYHDWFSQERISLCIFGLHYWGGWMKICYKFQLMHCCKCCGTCFNFFPKNHHLNMKFEVLATSCEGLCWFTVIIIWLTPKQSWMDGEKVKQYSLLWGMITSDKLAPAGW